MYTISSISRSMQCLTKEPLTFEILMKAGGTCLHDCFNAVHWHFYSLFFTTHILLLLSSAAKNLWMITLKTSMTTDSNLVWGLIFIVSSNHHLNLTMSNWILLNLIGTIKWGVMGKYFFQTADVNPWNDLMWYHYISCWFNHVNFRVFRTRGCAWNQTPAKIKDII